MRTMNLEHVKPCLPAAAGGLRMLRYDAGNLSGGQLVRDGPPRVGRDRAGADHRPRVLTA